MDCLNFNKKGKLQVLVKCSIKLSCPLKHDTTVKSWDLYFIGFRQNNAYFYLIQYADLSLNRGQVQSVEFLQSVFSKA